MYTYKDRICDFFCSDKVFDDVDLEYLISLIIDDRKLNNYVSIIIMNDNKRTMASYYPSDKKIIINPDVIYESSFNVFPRLGCDYTKDNLRRFYNYNCLISLFHELEHVEQTRFANESLDNDSLSLIVKEGIDYGSRLPDNVSLKEKMIYKFFYNFILTERDAWIKSYIDLFDLDSELHILKKEDIVYISKLLLSRILGNYFVVSNRIVSPSEIYFHIRDKSDLYKDINFSENYDLITKLSWGIPIDMESFRSISSLKKDIYDNSIKSKILSLRERI